MIKTKFIYFQKARCGHIVSVLFFPSSQGASSKLPFWKHFSNMEPRCYSTAPPRPPRKRWLRPYLVSEHQGTLRLRIISRWISVMFPWGEGGTLPSTVEVTLRSSRTLFLQASNPESHAHNPARDGVHSCNHAKCAFSSYMSVWEEVRKEFSFTESLSWKAGCLWR